MYTNTCHLVQKFSIDFVSSLNWSAYFASTDHCFQVSLGFEDDHVTHINKNFVISI